MGGMEQIRTASVFLCILSALALPTSTFASRPFRILGLYSTGFLGDLGPTYGIDAACISKAVTQQAKSEGVDVSFEVADSKWNPIAAAKAAQEAVNNNYDAVVGTISSSEALAAAPILDAARIPFLVPIATHPNVTLGREFVLRLPFTDLRQSVQLASFSVSELQARRVAVVRSVSSPYSNYLGKEFANGIRMRDSTVSVDEFPILEDFTDFAGLIKTVLLRKPDLIFLPLSELIVASIYSELKKAGVNITVLASDTIDGRPEFIKLLGTLSPKIRFVASNYWNGLLRGPYAARYERLHAKHCAEHAPSRFSVAAFEAMTMLIEALKRKPLLRRSDAIAVIKQLNFPGLSGTFHYGQNNDPKKPIQIFILEKSRFVFWKEIGK